jgi:hypothetical protein
LHHLQGRSWGQFLNVQSQVQYPKVPSGGDDINSDCLAPTSGAGLVMRPDQDGKYGGRVVFCSNGPNYNGDVPVYSDTGGATYNFSKDLYSAQRPADLAGMDECQIAQVRKVPSWPRTKIVQGWPKLRDLAQ